MHLLFKNDSVYNIPGKVLFSQLKTELNNKKVHQIF